MRIRVLAVIAMLAGMAAGSSMAQMPPAPPELRCPLDGTYDANNSFARIIRGEIPVSMIAQDQEVLAFVPLGWEHPGHALVVPRRPVRNLNEMTDAEMVAVMHMVKRIAAAQEKAFGSTGFTLEQNNGRNQEVCHAHFHVIPNTIATSGDVRPSRAEMDLVASKLRAALPPDSR